MDFITIRMAAHWTLGVFTVVAAIRARRSWSWGWATLVAAGLLAASNVRGLLPRPPRGDLLIFWNAGLAAMEGRNPYADRAFVSTPNALALFMAFALIAPAVLAVLWWAFNLLGALALVPLSRALVEEDSAGPPPQSLSLTAVQVLGLTAATTFSDASLRNASGGQVHVFAALMIVIALRARARGRAAAAGLALGLACVKAHTVLPFLFLLRRRADGKIVVTMILTLAVFCLLAVPVASAPGWLAAERANLAALAAPGGGNDYAFGGPAEAGMLGFNHTLYRLGLRDRATIGRLHLMLNLALGAWVAWRVWSGMASEAAGYALVALYTPTFLYHRLYDTVILALPLTYVAARYDATASTAARRLYGLIGLAVATILFIPEFTLGKLTERVAGPGPVAMAPALATPFWLLLLCLATLSRADRLDRAARGCGRLDPGPSVS